MHKRNSILKLTAIAVFSALVITYCSIGRSANAFSAGPPIGRTGAPALGAFPSELTCVGCHSSFVLNSGPGVLSISGLPATYTANQEVTITISLNQADRAKFGFEATMLDDLGRRAGDLTATDTTNTQIINGTGNFSGRQYITHTAAGNVPNGTNQSTWTFKWKAPAQNVGRVTLYVSGNAANGNGNNAADYIYVTNASSQAAVPPLPQVAAVSAASFGGTLTSESIAALFGMNLANNNASATTLPLPTTLGGVAVKVKDNLGTERDAGLFFAGKGQINYLMPANTAAGLATVTVLRDGTAIASGNVPVDTVAPALFSANSNGAGIAAAVLVRIKANGDRTFETISQFDQAQNRQVATPIDLGAETDQLILVLFGTGLRANTALSTTTCQIGGTSAEVLFTGAVPGFAGLDQVNVRIPRSLAGRGNVNVALTIATKAANTVSINVR